MSSLYKRIGGEAAVENLAATRKELGVNDTDIQEVATTEESVRDDVLNR
jgi:hypothetical protein